PMGRPGVTQLHASAARHDDEKEKGRALALPEPRCGGSATLDGLVTSHRLPEASIKTGAPRFAPAKSHGAHRVIDLSQSGAASQSRRIRGSLWASLSFGKTQGRVVRHIEDGFAIEFMQLRKFCPRIFRRPFAAVGPYWRQQSTANGRPETRVGLY